MNTAYTVKHIQKGLTLFCKKKWDKGVLLAGLIFTAAKSIIRA